MEEPPQKRLTCRDDVPFSYYHLHGTVIPIFGIYHKSDLETFKGAFIPEDTDAEIVGTTEETPLWITPYLSTLLLAAPNPVCKLSAIADSIGKLTNECRDPEILAVVCDLCSSVNKGASEYWLRRYESIVDSICRDEHPTNDILLEPEKIVEIAKLIKEGEETLEPYFPETRNINFRTNPVYVAMDIMKEAAVATGGNRRFLNRIMALGNLGKIPNYYVYRKFEDEYYEVYWKWRSTVELPENEFEDTCITEAIAYRHAILYENTRKLFKSVYSNSSKYVFIGDYSWEEGCLSNWKYRMVDPKTGNFVKLTEWDWSLDLVHFINRVGYHMVPLEMSTRALQTLPSVSIAMFTTNLFRINALSILLLNKDPSGFLDFKYKFAYKSFYDLKESDLYWENLERVPKGSLPITKFPSGDAIPVAIRDPTAKNICLHPKLRPLFTCDPLNYEGRMMLNQFDDGEFPLGKVFDLIIRSTTVTKCYSINQQTRDIWKLLSRYQCGHYFNGAIQRKLKNCYV